MQPDTGHDEEGLEAVPAEDPEERSIPIEQDVPGAVEQEVFGAPEQEPEQAVFGEPGQGDLGLSLDSPRFSSEEVSAPVSEHHRASFTTCLLQDRDIMCSHAAEAILLGEAPKCLWKSEERILVSKSPDKMGGDHFIIEYSLLFFNSCIHLSI